MLQRKTIVSGLLKGRLADGRYFLVIAPDGRIDGAYENNRWYYLRSGSGLRHSSFLGGADVSDAFTLRVKEGQIHILSDDSGHYVPDVIRMHHTLRRLETRALPLSSCSARRFPRLFDAAIPPTWR